jgi:hypothetical protein
MKNSILPACIKRKAPETNRGPVEIGESEFASGE